MTYNHNKLSTEEAIFRSKSKFGDRFSYERTIYTGSFDPFVFTCKLHGDITTTFTGHIKAGCTLCNKEDKRQQSAKAFLEKVSEVLGDLYDFSLCEYKTSIECVKIICREHGIFEMCPSNLLSGQRCPKCSRKRQADFHRMPEEEFKKRGSERYSGKFDYTLVEYTKNSGKVKIICPVHGIFKQSPAQHLSGEYGCTECGKEQCGKTKTLNRATTFLPDVAKVHGSTYTLDKTDYRGKDKPVTVTCRIHGDFQIMPHSLLAGSGCKNCAENGYRTKLPGKLYVLNYEEYVKIGITNNEVEDRRRRVSRSSDKEFSIVKTYEFEDGWTPYNIETALLRELSATYQNPTIKFEGYTETYIGVNLAALLNRIEELISQQTKEHHSSNNQAAQAA